MFHMTCIASEDPYGFIGYDPLLYIVCIASHNSCSPIQSTGVKHCYNVISRIREQVAAEEASAVARRRRAAPRTPVSCSGSAWRAASASTPANSICQTEREEKKKSRFMNDVRDDDVPRGLFLCVAAVERSRYRVVKRARV